MNSNRNKEGRDRDGGKRSNSNGKNSNTDLIALAKNVNLAGKISGFADNKVFITVEGLRDFFCQEPHPGVLTVELTDISLRVDLMSYI